MIFQIKYTDWGNVKYAYFDTDEADGQMENIDFYTDYVDCMHKTGKNKLNDDQKKKMIKAFEKYHEEQSKKK